MNMDWGVAPTDAGLTAQNREMLTEVERAGCSWRIRTTVNGGWFVETIPVDGRAKGLRCWDGPSIVSAIRNMYVGFFGIDALQRIDNARR